VRLRTLTVDPFRHSVHPSFRLLSAFLRPFFVECVAELLPTEVPLKCEYMDVYLSPVKRKSTKQKSLVRPNFDCVLIDPTIFNRRVCSFWIWIWIWIWSGVEALESTKCFFSMSFMSQQLPFSGTSILSSRANVHVSVPE
jgi:hypothetical protein